jgi:V/A-type H+-transporting ATPase subunit K
MMSGLQASRRLRTFIQVSFLATLALVLLGMTLATVRVASSEAAAPAGAAVNVFHPELATNIGSGLIAAGIVAGISTLGAGVAVAYVGAAAVGAVSEKPEVFGRAIIFVALGEGLAVLGLVMAFMILNIVNRMLP